MAVLHNRISNKELKERLFAEKTLRTTISFYHYFNIPDPKAFRDELYIRLTQLQVFGRIYVASEGINAQVSVPDTNVKLLEEYLYSLPGLNGMRLNYAVDNDGKSFWVLKVKVREKIVADGIDDPGFSMEKRGKYVDARQMNEMIEKGNVHIVDMRNHYEYEVGHFDNAIEIPSDNFREQLPMAKEILENIDKGKDVVMYCTGGIRCEKASAYFLYHGFQNVYHLEGGIINYARQAKAKGLQSKFKGKIFVFDERLGEKVTADVISKCHSCGQPSDTHINCANSACHRLVILCSDCRNAYEQCCSTTCRDTIHLPEEVQKELRRGVKKKDAPFNKSRQRRRATADNE